MEKNQNVNPVLGGQQELVRGDGVKIIQYIDIAFQFHHHNHQYCHYLKNGVIKT